MYGAYPSKNVIVDSLSLTKGENVVAVIFAKASFNWLWYVNRLFSLVKGFQYYLVFTDRRIFKIDLTQLGVPFRDSKSFSRSDVSNVFIKEKMASYRLEIELKNGEKIKSIIPKIFRFKNQKDDIEKISEMWYN